jgi:hypothetical protein
MIEALAATGVQSLFGDPALNHVSSQSPVAADSKAWNLAVPCQPVNGRPMDSQQIANLFYRENFMGACHRNLTFLLPCQRMRLSSATTGRER